MADNNNEKAQLAPDVLWAGTDASWYSYLAAASQFEGLTMKAWGGNDEDGDEDVPRLLSQSGGVATVTLAGSMVNSKAWWHRYAGITSYSEIREALVYAAKDQDTKVILLDINSGGGAVSGVTDLADLIMQVDRQVKPVYAFTDGTMASAAYWLGSGARKTYTSKVGLVGSIGVIAGHAENSEAMKRAGVNVTVFRAGKYKALGNSMEPLTDEARKEIQARLDTTYRIFVQHVSTARNVSYERADQDMGQGREFMGAESVSVGLTDGVTTFDSLFSALSKEFIDSSNNLIDNAGKFQLQQEHGMSKTALTDAEIAAMAEGAGQQGAETGGQELAAETTTEAALTAETAQGEESASVAQADTGVVDFLKAEIKERDQALAGLRSDLAAARTQLDDLQASHASLIAIAANSINNMSVGLGAAKPDMAGWDATRTLAEHRAVSERFSSKFKAGQVSASVSDRDAGVAPVSALEKARLRAAMINPNKTNNK